MRDPIFRSPNGRLTVGLATDTDLELIKSDRNGLAPDDVLEDWWPVAIQLEGASIRLLGTRRREGDWITSEVRGLDRNSRLVRTPSDALYEPGAQGLGDCPPPHSMSLLRVALRIWRFGIVLRSEQAADV